MLSSCPAWIGASSLAGCEGRGDEYEEGRLGVFVMFVEDEYEEGGDV